MDEAETHTEASRWKAKVKLELQKASIRVLIAPVNNDFLREKMYL